MPGWIVREKRRTDLFSVRQIGITCRRLSYMFRQPVVCAHHSVGLQSSNPTELASVVFGLLHYVDCFCTTGLEVSRDEARSAKAWNHRGKLGGVSATAFVSRFAIAAGESRRK